ncbi:MAG: hypothetical protein CM1200mP10_32570 [Candidatus Neomarinimicrobiota bacterium]|nr:MAG: hypothetical protein CM1200mP10_32570 [Candidatus Neomarinimicrobiota bacterium]
MKKRGIKVISNAGGINPEACRAAVMKEAKKAGVELNIALVKGDNLFDQKKKLQALPVTELETGKTMPDGITSINAYLGASGKSAHLRKEQIWLLQEDVWTALLSWTINV